MPKNTIRRTQKQQPRSRESIVSEIVAAGILEYAPEYVPVDRFEWHDFNITHDALLAGLRTKGREDHIDGIDARRAILEAHLETPELKRELYLLLEGRDQRANLECEAAFLVGVALGKRFRAEEAL